MNYKVLQIWPPMISSETEDLSFVTPFISMSLTFFLPVKNLKIGTPKTVTIIVFGVEQFSFTMPLRV